MRGRELCAPELQVRRADAARIGLGALGLVSPRIPGERRARCTDHPRRRRASPGARRQERRAEAVEGRREVRLSRGLDRVVRAAHAVVAELREDGAERDEIAGPSDAELGVAVREVPRRPAVELEPLRRSGEPEIEHVHPAVVAYHQVAGLDVAV